MKPALWLAALLTAPAHAAPWEFSVPLDVMPPQPGVFQQLDSAGRKHVAVSGDTLAVVWEESRGGVSQVHVAFKPLSASLFSLQRVSAGTAASLPVIAALDDNRFLLAWEQDGGVWARVVDAGALGVSTRLARKATQPSLAVLDRKIIAAWADEQDRFPRIRSAFLKIDGLHVDLDGTARDVDHAAPAAEQLYPDVVLTPSGAGAVWEDRRHGHTVLLYAFSKSGGRFGQPKILNEQPPKRSEAYGKGTGVARAALARHGRQGVAAVWLDKRSFLEGYDVYAGFARDGARFSANEKVQDDFGNNISQWHATLATSADGRTVVLWDDDRDGTADVWLAWPVGNGRWSESLSVPAASGPNQQSNPVAVFDAGGRLHLVWIERETSEAPTRLRYVSGKFLK